MALVHVQLEHILQQELLVVFHALLAVPHQRDYQLALVVLAMPNQDPDQH